MVTNDEKKTKKKKKIKPYDVDESKKIFLFAYEHELLNEKINWKKAEELKITNHSAGSMRSHYINQIKNESSLYLEMYPEEVAKLFAKVKKMKRTKKTEQQNRNLSITNNFAKQTSNISLNRLTKCGSIGAGFNKMNSLSIDKLFSSNYGKNKKKGRTILSNFGERANKKARKMEGGKEENDEENDEENVEENEKQGKNEKDGEIKRKKIDKKKNKKNRKKQKGEKTFILKSSVNKTYKNITTQPPKDMLTDSIKVENGDKNRKDKEVEKEKEKEKENEIAQKGGSKQKIDENKGKELSENADKKNISAKKLVEKKDETSENTQVQKNIKKGRKTESEDERSVLQKNNQNVDMKKVNQNVETPENKFVNNVNTEEKKSTIGSIFGYIFKKIFH